jgi:hypothetical protein
MRARAADYFVLLTHGKEFSGMKWQPEKGAFFGRAGYLPNGLTALTPNGHKLNDDYWAALREWNRKPLAERQKLDDLGEYDPDYYPPKPPPGGLILRMHRRALERGAGGRWVRPVRVVSKEGALLESNSQVDHLWLTAEEVRALAPDGRRVKNRYAAPPAVVDRLCRFHLIDATTGITEQQYWRPEDVASQTLWLTVGEVTADRAELWLDGTASYGPGLPPEGRTTFHLEGRATYERALKAFTRFDVAALSESAHLEQATKKRQALAVAFELVRGTRPADRIPPFYVNETGYWGPGR